MKNTHGFTCLVLMLIILTFCQAANAENAEQTWALLAESVSGSVIAVKADGTVLAAGDNNSGECNVQSWNNIQKVAVGFTHTVGLKIDGTVLATGGNEFGQCDVQKWNEIVDIAADVDYTLGLKSDGTIILAGQVPKRLRSIVNKWKDVTKVFGSNMYIAGITKDDCIITLDTNVPIKSIQPVQVIVGDIEDMYVLSKKGTVVAYYLPSANSESRCLDICNVTQLLYSYSGNILLLKSDGTVNSDEYQPKQATWSDVVAITSHYGLKKDGTIITTLDDETANAVIQWKLW